MERLTLKEGLCYMASTEFCLEQKDCYTCSHGRKCFKHLAAYEDTGLEPKEVLTGKELAEIACAINLLKEYQSFGSIDHLRELAQAEKAGRLVVLPPNDPLTLEQLREMDGEPVYVTGTFTDCRGERPGAWALVDVKQKMCRVHGGGLAIFENCGKHWLAYRRKPEELT